MKGLQDRGSGSDSRKRKLDAFEWETSKENVVPLKRGRNVADLNKALRAHDSFQTKMRLDNAVKAKEDTIKAYDGDDPLADWLEYVRWLEVKLPEDTRKKFTVLEKCTRTLKDNPRYRNDIRYIRLWIQYADLVSNPKDIFKYLYQNKIGERVSLFYIGWAYVLETMANYPQAHKIYLKASQKNAEPQDLLERKYKEFQRRMSRQWLKMTAESTGGDDEVNHRHALESLSSHGVLVLSDAQRQQLQEQQASVRAERVQRQNAHKPVFTIYEDPVRHTVDPFDGNGGWRKLDTVQQQNKENVLEPTTWNPPVARRVAEPGRQTDRRQPPGSNGHPESSPLQVFVDDEFAVSDLETKRPTPLTNRSLTLRQRVEGIATEEELLAQEPLKNFTASHKKAREDAKRQKHRSFTKLEKPCYDPKQLTTDTGEALSFEEVRARAYKRAADRHRKLDSRALRDTFINGNDSFQVAAVDAASSSSMANTSRKVKPAAQKSAFSATTAVLPSSKLAGLQHDDQEDMTINTRVALEEINGMFCSPPRQPHRSARDAKDEDPVERKLQFSVFDDSVDSVAVNAQDQSHRQDPNESIPKQTFQIFSDDAPEPPLTGKKTWSHRKPLGARDDLVRSGRLTNKDVLMQAEKDAATKESVKSHWMRDSIMSTTRKVPPSNTLPSAATTTDVRSHHSKNASVPAFTLDPYTFDNRQALVLDRRVDWYLCSRPDTVKLHSQKLPRLPCNNPTKRKLRKPIIVKLSATLSIELIGVLGAGSFAYVYSGRVIDTSTNSTSYKAIKLERKRQNLAWEFYITNKIRKKLIIEDKLAEEEIPVPSFSGLHLFPNGAMLLMNKGYLGTLHDVLSRYQQAAKSFPEVLVVYYGIKMLRCIEILHSAQVLHGDIKPDNWLLTPGNPELVLSKTPKGSCKSKSFQSGDLHLIDYGRSIDLTLYPEGTAFIGNCHATGFQCVEMLTQRPWTQQIDTFAFCGTLHCMLFGNYMEVKPRRNSKGVTQWGITRPFKRYWQADMWKDIFHALLNVSSCEKQPSLPNLRRRLEGYFASDPSRQQELYKQLGHQDRFLTKSTV